MTDINSMIDEAFSAAARSTSLYLTGNPTTWYPCGFAEVRIRPARGPLVTALKKRGLGRSAIYGGGYVISNPSQNCTQSMSAKAVGARAFIDSMLAAQSTVNLGNVTFSVETQID